MLRSLSPYCSNNFSDTVQIIVSGNQRCICESLSHRAVRYILSEALTGFHQQAIRMAMITAFKFHNIIPACITSLQHGWHSSPPPVPELTIRIISMEGTAVLNHLCQLYFPISRCPKTGKLSRAAAVTAFTTSSFGMTKNPSVPMSRHNPHTDDLPHHRCVTPFAL